MHLVEPVGDLLEALAEARLERRMQLLVDRRSHLLELHLVALLQRGEALLDRRAHFDEAPLVRLGQRPQLFAERVSEALQREVLRVASRVALRQQRLLKHRQGLADFLPRSDAASRDLVAQFALEPLAVHRHEALQPISQPIDRRLARHQPHQKPYVQRQRAEDQPVLPIHPVIVSGRSLVPRMTKRRQRLVDVHARSVHCTQRSMRRERMRG